MSRKTVCQKQTLFRERDQDKNLFVLYSWEWDDWSDFVCDANAFCCSKRCYCAKRYPHVNLIYLEARIDPSTWLTIMLWRNIGRLDFQAAKVIICPMLKLQMVGVEQKMAFKLEGKKGFNSKLCPLNRMVFLRQKTPWDPFLIISRVLLKSFYQARKMRSKNRSVIGVDRVVKCTRKLEFTVDTQYLRGLW